MNVKHPRVILHAGREQSLLRRHPWIFSGAVRKTEGAPQDGDLVDIVDAKGNLLAKGHYFNGSIAVKVLSFVDTDINEDFWKSKVAAAFQRRKRVGLPGQPAGNAFRLINGEGDDFPGLIADMYNGILVLQAHSIGMHRILRNIVSAIIEVSDGSVRAVYDKSKESLPAAYAQQVTNQWIVRPQNDEVIEINENGMRLRVDIVKGQKTGFFLDQRDNRKLLTQYAGNASVLNTFCYTGGFSVAAAKGGAKSVTSVDASSQAISLAKENIRLNGFSDIDNPCYQDDVYTYLKNCNNRFDIVVLDPPAFAKSMAKKHNAIQGYKRLNESGMEKVNPGGLLFTFSCSQVVDAEAFQGAVLSAAIACGRPARILHRLSQPPDHPVNIFHPEGAYLKGLVIQLD